MKIKTIEAWQVKMRLSEPYTIAYETISSADTVFIRIRTDKGINGYGCAAPDLQVTGETAGSVLVACEDIIIPSIKGSDPLRTAFLLQRIKKSLQSQPSAVAMVDMALYDILGKTAGLPLYKLLGGFRTSMKTSITIGIMPVEETVKKAKEFIKRGFKSLKIKGGSDVESDIERIVKVREAVGKTIEIRFDANQGYTVEESLTFFKSTRTSRDELAGCLSFGAEGVGGHGEHQADEMRRHFRGAAYQCGGPGGWPGGNGGLYG
jgi:L-alanine-DL-glutamate epimerase-like enolase superfamily enzyme